MSKFYFDTNHNISLKQNTLLSLLKIVPVFAAMMLAVSFYIKVHYRLFWNIVLVDSKGLVPDLLMWLYYILIGLISISPSYIALIHFMS